MPVASIGQAPSAAEPSQTTLSQQDFLRILTTQLSFQDPLKPLDNQQFMAQMAQFAALEQSRNLSAAMDTLLAIQSATQSLGLLGRTVEVNTSGGLEVGSVTALRFVNGQPAMDVRTSAGSMLSDVGLSAIGSVR